MVEDLLVANGIEAGYPGKKILFGVDFTVRRGEVVVLLGANGSGKSTALNAVSGFIKPTSGRILFGGQHIAGKPSHQIFQLGIAQVSQARDLFPDMTVEDNLRIGAARRPSVNATAALESIYRDFPRLGERRQQMVRTMSGGEQQMVAIARADVATDGPAAG